MSDEKHPGLEYLERAQAIAEIERGLQRSVRELVMNPDAVDKDGKPIRERVVEGEARIAEHRAEMGGVLDAAQALMDAKREALQTSANSGGVLESSPLDLPPEKPSEGREMGRGDADRMDA